MPFTSELKYAPEFQHEDWVDNVDVVQAAGEDGFNRRFHDLEEEFARIKAVLDNLTGENLTVQGKVGIGTTSPQYRLDVQGPNSGHGLRVFAGGSTSSDFVFQATNGANTDIMSIKGNGNVGIGTTTPGEPLEVNGRIKSGALTVGPWPANPNYVFFGTNALDQASAGNYALLQGVVAEKGATFLNSPEYIRFSIGNADKMILTKDGNVGIGTTSPHRPLTIESFDASISLQDLTLPRGTRWEIQAGAFFAGAGAFGIVQYDGGNAQESRSVIVRQSGNVGIGTASPQSKLHIDATSPGNPSGFNPLIIVGQAHEINAKSQLDSLPNNTLIFGGQSGDKIYFFWKDISGKKYELVLEGTEF